MSGLSAEEEEDGTKNMGVLSAGLSLRSALRIQHLSEAREVRDGTCGDYRRINRRFACRL